MNPRPSDGSGLIWFALTVLLVVLIVIAAAGGGR